MTAKRTAVLAMMICCASACGADKGDVKFDSIDLQIKDKKFTLEVADTEARRSRGLMYRKSMAADHGMLFVFDKPDTYAFWMKNTEIPLDLVFLDGAGKVIGIYALKPHDQTNVGPDKPAQFAIELNAGTARTVGLKPGDTVTLPEKVLEGAGRSDEK
jgi:uncharacterized membrane protein (UPF0127 family)